MLEARSSAEGGDTEGGSVGVGVDLMSVDVSKSERQIWLVKVPSFVDKVWREAIERAHETGEVQHIGEVTMGTATTTTTTDVTVKEEKGGEKRKDEEEDNNSSVNEFKLRLVEGSTASGAAGSSAASSPVGKKAIPLDYALVPAVSSQALACMHAMSFKGNDRPLDGAELQASPSVKSEGGGRAARAVSLEGRVGHQFLVRPKIDKSYRQISRERMKKGSHFQAKTKVARLDKIQLLRDDKQSVKMQTSTTPLPVSYVGGAKYKREQGRKQTDFKRVKMESKEGLLSWIFELFRRESYWTFSALQEATHQPTRFLMEVLKECATKVHEGPHANKWELKEKYRVPDGQ